MIVPHKIFRISESGAAIGFLACHVKGRLAERLKNEYLTYCRKKIIPENLLLRTKFCVLNAMFTGWVAESPQCHSAIDK
jgi:hypothetical protein